MVIEVLLHVKRLEREKKPEACADRSSSQCMSQACVSRPIRADWEIQEAGLEEYSAAGLDGVFFF